MRYSLYEILVPTQMTRPTPTGPQLRPIRTRFHRIWDAKIRDIAGGLTISTPALGQWISPNGTLFKEKMIPVRVMCTEEQIENIAKITQSYYQQEAVMFYRISDRVEIRNYNEG